MTEEESQTIVNAYERAIKPLSKLRGKGLNRFFKDLKLPWGRAVKSIRKQKEEPSAYMAELRELQLWGERLVMGGNVQGNLTSLNGVYRHSNITVSDAAIYHGNYFSLVLSICEANEAPDLVNITDRFGPRPFICKLFLPSEELTFSS